MQVGPSYITQKITRVSLFLVFAALSFLDSGAAHGQAQNLNLKNRYENIEVIPFDVKPGIEFPNDYRTRMMADVVKDLRGINKFKQVLAEGEAQQGGNASTIQLKGSVMKYKHGNRGKRLIALGLAGDTKVVAHVKFIDKATGKLLVEADVDGQVYTGLLGGSPRGAPSGIGKDIAKIAKKVFF